MKRRGRPSIWTNASEALMLPAGNKEKWADRRKIKSRSVSRGGVLDKKLVNIETL